MGITTSRCGTTFVSRYATVSGLCSVRNVDWLIMEGIIASRGACLVAKNGTNVVVNTW